jgi:hypothetical protein
MSQSPIPRLDDLVSTIEGQATDPLQQLSTAVIVAQHLEELADHLIGHFVDRARESGASWTLIGQSLGVTKQAAQKRFVPGEPETAAPDLRVFARYTDHARGVIVRAQEQARERAATAIQPGHVLLALLEEEEIHQFLGGADVGAVRTAVADALGRGAVVPEGNIPFSAASKKALELAHREALRRNDEQIHPKYLLLGVLASPEDLDIAAAGLDRQRIEAGVQ